jgi:hypothetical protein
MRALKILVVVMGVMVVAGMALLAVGIADHLGHGHLGVGAAAPEVTPGGHHAIDLPVGAKVLGMAGDGGRVILRLGLADGGEQLWLVDWNTGARLAIIDLRPGGAERKP